MGMQYFSCCSDKYTEIKMCDLEPFSKIQSHIVLAFQPFSGNKTSVVLATEIYHFYSPMDPFMTSSILFYLLCHIRICCNAHPLCLCSCIRKTRLLY